ncbi:MAG: 30S ribosomal protein S8 [Candidatus Pacearchaeota archaeon]|nr:30S ribosomal protein S8 [Candidatus Pacearchaeota archaeon]
MSQDITADCLNMMMNVKKAGRKELEVSRISEFLIRVLEIAKKNDYIDFKKDKGKVRIEIKKLSNCQAIKPRFNVKSTDIEKYLRRYMPARDFGILLISTSKGIMTQEEALKEKIGGSLIAYFY